MSSFDLSHQSCEGPGIPAAYPGGPGGFPTKELWDEQERTGARYNHGPIGKQFIDMQLDPKYTIDGQYEPINVVFNVGSTEMDCCGVESNHRVVSLNGSSISDDTINGVLDTFATIYNTEARHVVLACVKDTTNNAKITHLYLGNGKLGISGIAFKLPVLFDNVIIYNFISKNGPDINHVNRTINYEYAFRYISKLIFSKYMECHNPSMTVCINSHPEKLYVTLDTIQTSAKLFR